MKRENQGKVVRVYRNLRKGGYSVVDVKTQRVMFIAQSVALVEVEFVVRPARRAKVLKEKRKNVHAFARGILCGTDFKEQKALGSVRGWCEVPVRYDPYESDGFLTPSGRKIRYADMVILDERGVHINEGASSLVNNP